MTQRITRSRTRMSAFQDTNASTSVVQGSDTDTVTPDLTQLVEQLQQELRELRVGNAPEQHFAAATTPQFASNIHQRWPKFSGKISETTNKNGQKIPAENIDCFLFDIEHAFIASNIIANAVKLATVNNCLEDGAKIWFRSTSIATPFTSWNNFKVRAKEQFTLLHQQTQLRSELKALRQDSGETIMEYINKFRSIVMLIEDMSELDKIHTFTSALHPSTQMHIRLQNPRTVHDAMNIAVAHDQAYRSSHSNNRKNDTTPKQKSDSNKKNTQSNQSNQSNKSDKNSMEVDTISKDTKKMNWEQIKKEGRCVRCFEKGHIGINCKKHPGPAPPKKDDKDTGKDSNQ
jgi:hypothetical protein